MAHKTTVTFSDQAWRTVEDLTQETGHSMSEVLRDAIKLYRWSLEVRASGGHVLVERDGRTSELVSL